MQIVRNTILMGLKSVYATYTTLIISGQSNSQYNNVKHLTILFGHFESIISDFVRFFSNSDKHMK